MKSAVASILVSSLLVPACLTEGEDLETAQDQSEIIIGGGSTSTQRYTSKILTTGDMVQLWGSSFRVPAKLVDMNGTGLWGYTLTLSDGKTSWSDVSGYGDVEVVVNNEAWLGNLGGLGPRTMTWSVPANSVYPATSASFKVTYVRTDCIIPGIYSEWDPATHKLKISTSLHRNTGGFYHEADEGGHLIEFSIDGHSVGTALTQPGTGKATISVVPPDDNGVIQADFAGNTFIGGCSGTRDFDLTPPRGRLWVASSLENAKIGSSTVTLHATSEVQDFAGIYHRRPYTQMSLYAVTTYGISGSARRYLGDVTTNAYGDAYLTLPVTALAHSDPGFVAGDTHFTAESDAPIRYKDFDVNTNYGPDSNMYITKGTAVVKRSILALDYDYGYHDELYTITNQATGKPIADFLLWTPCGQKYSDANGKIACEFYSGWWQGPLFDAVYGDAWNAVLQ